MNPVKIRVDIEDARNNDLLKERFFEQNMGLVYSVAHDFKNSMDFDDAFGIAQFGLLKAFNTFDINAGATFATYSLRVMKNEILMELRRKRFKTQSFDHVISDGNSDDEDLTLANIISTPEEDFKFEDFDALESIMNRFIENAKVEDERLIPAFKMYVLEDKTTTEIGKAIGIGQSGAARMAKRAVKAFQDAAIELGIVDCHNDYYKRTSGAILKKQKERDDAIRAKILYALINFPQLTPKDISNILGYDSYTVALMRGYLNKGKDFKIKPDSSIEPILEIYLEKKKSQGY